MLSVFSLGHHLPLFSYPRSVFWIRFLNMLTYLSVHSHTTSGRASLSRLQWCSIPEPVDAGQPVCNAFVKKKTRDEFCLRVHLVPPSSDLISIDADVQSVGISYTKSESHSPLLSLFLISIRTKTSGMAARTRVCVPSISLVNAHSRAPRTKVRIMPI